MDDKLTLSIDDYEICNKLKSMRFPGMAHALEEVFSDPNADMKTTRNIWNGTATDSVNGLSGLA